MATATKAVKRAWLPQQQDCPSRFGQYRLCRPHLLPSDPALDFPGEAFRVLKQKEEKAFGEYRTRRLVLEAWERQAGRGGRQAG